MAGTDGQLIFNNAGAAAGLSTLTADTSGNLTFTARWIQSTNGAASAPPMSLTGTWFTGGTSTTTKPQFLIEPAGTTSTSWNTAGTGLGVNAPSGFGGDLAWFGVGGSVMARIRNNGDINLAGALTSNLIYAGSGGYIITGNTIRVNNAGSFQFGSSGNSFDAGDLIILRDAPNTQAQRNGTAAQTSRLYNTFTDSSNYERLAHTWVSNVCYTRPENAGTGSARLYVPVTGGTTVANLPAAATAGTGARSFVTDANAATFLSTVAGGGSNRVPVVSDGTNWLIA